MLAVVGCRDAVRDWRDEVIYFALIDRLANGDPSNDDQGMGEWDPSRESHYHGGDLEGVLGALDGIEALGATSVWLTPPVRNQWWNPERTYTGYHGYWASDFEHVDPHFGSLQDWRNVADALHARGMRLIQDVVVNHAGDWVLVTDSGIAVRDLPLAGWMHPDSGAYHRTPPISDYGDADHLLTHELAGLDDFRTESERVRVAMRAIYRKWLEEGGADGFRFDTHKYVERSFWPAFLEGKPGDLGVRRFAELRGRAFPNFGEVWTHSEPFADDGEREMLGFLRSPGYEGVDALLNFPLQASLLRVFGEGGDAGDLAHRLSVQSAMFPNPASQLVNFIDNHDMARFRSTAGEQATRQALNALLSLPGVPVIYQGTEQGDLEPRQNLFHRFDTASASFLWLQGAIAWRHAHPVVRRGRVVQARSVTGTPIVHWSVAWQGDTVHVLCNASAERIVASERPSVEGNRCPIPSRREQDVAVVFAGEQLAFADLGPHAWLAWSEWELLEPAAPVAGCDTAWAVDGRLLADGWEHVPSGVHRVQPAFVTEADEVVGLGAFAMEDVRHPRRVVGRFEDACGDDRGLAGQIQPPTSPGFDHSMDMAALEIVQDGAHWEIRLAMCTPWSTVWNPRFGFDHVAFDVRIEPVEASPDASASADAAHGQGATRSVPQEDHARWRHSGWSLQPLHGAVPTTEGVQHDQLVWRIPAPSTGLWQVVVDTWDADGNGAWRSLVSDPEPYAMSSSEVEAARVMDRLIAGPMHGAMGVTLTDEYSRID